jgi:hypothetical protein
MNFCTEDGCFEVAIGVSRWEGRGANRNEYPKRKSDKCRPHHLERIADQIVTCEVIAPEEIEIADVVTGEPVAAGGTVRLDPGETNLAILVGLGYVRIPKPEAKTKAEPKTAVKADTKPA